MVGVCRWVAFMGVQGHVALPPCCRIAKAGEAGLGEQEGLLCPHCVPKAFCSQVLLSRAHFSSSPAKLHSALIAFSETHLFFVPDKSLWCQAHPGTRGIEAHLSHNERPLLRDLYEGKCHLFPAPGTEGQGPVLRAKGGCERPCCLPDPEVGPSPGQPHTRADPPSAGPSLGRVSLCLRQKPILLNKIVEGTGSPHPHPLKRPWFWRGTSC